MITRSAHPDTMPHALLRNIRCPRVCTNTAVQQKYQLEVRGEVWGVLTGFITFWIMCIHSLVRAEPQIRIALG